MPRLTLQVLSDYSFFVKRALMSARPMSNDNERLEWLESLADQPYSREKMKAFLQGADDAEILAERMRLLRREVLLTLVARDVTGQADYFEVVRTMTDLAEETVSRTVRVHAKALSLRYGVPTSVLPLLTELSNS